MTAAVKVGTKGFWYGALTALLLSASLAAAQVPPPPPPPSERRPPAGRPGKPAKRTADERYAECLERMVETGNPSHAFMRQCLGLKPKPKPTPKPPKKRKTPPRPKSKDRRGSAKATAPAATKSQTPATEGFATRLSVLMPKLGGCLAELSSGLKSYGLAPAGAFTVALKFQQGTVESVSFPQTTINDANFLACIEKSLVRASLLEPSQAGKVQEAQVKFAITRKGKERVLEMSGSPTIK